MACKGRQGIGAAGNQGCRAQPGGIGEQQAGISSWIFDGGAA
jgi:hypothetical protein